MKSIYDLGKEYGFRIIEDASHALGGTYKKMPIGNCQFSDITVFSFHPVKIITSGEGGVAVTNDQDLAEKLRLLRSHGVVRDSRMQPEDSADEIWNYRQEILGFNYRMTDIQAVLGLSQMVRVNAFVSSRREVAMKYGADLQHLPIELPWQHPETVSSYHLYPIRINLSRAGISQKLFYEEMQRNGVGVNLHYAPVYRHPFYRAMGFKRGYCPEAELYFQEAISLPIFPALKELEYLKIISSIKALL
jgi:dTDP-4-amino-4,6-dideoxygalactose transaminase